MKKVINIIILLPILYIIQCKLCIAGMGNCKKEDNAFALLLLALNHSAGFYFPRGELDPTFDNDGIVISSIGSQNDVGNSIVVQSDGKILISGYFKNTNNDDLFILRLNKNGSIDSTYGYSGISIKDIDNESDYVAGMILQSDGKILVSGHYSTGGFYDIYVARYKNIGIFDDNFGTNSDGIVKTQITGDNDYTQDIALKLNGKIIVTGYDISNNIFLMQYNTDGYPDNSFGTNGKIIIDWGSTGDKVKSIMIQNNGKIILAGEYFNFGTDLDFYICRYNEDGTLDTSFGNNGKVIRDIDQHYDYVNSIALQNDGKIIIGGSFYNGNDYEIVLIRYDQYGNIDTSFGSNGISTLSVSDNDDLGKIITIQQDGKIIMAGTTYNGNNYDVTLARFNTDGTIDTTFGNNGIVITSVGGNDTNINDMALQSDGKIVLTGSIINKSNLKDVIVLRYK